MLPGIFFGLFPSSPFSPFLTLLKLANERCCLVFDTPLRNNSVSQLFDVYRATMDVQLVTVHYCLLMYSCLHYSLLLPAPRYVLARVLAVIMCVCPSVTSRCSTETVKRRITQTTPHDSPGTLVSDAENLDKTETGSPQQRRQMQVG